MMNYDILERYDMRVPRYTSYPTAPHFEAIDGDSAFLEDLKALPEDEAISLYLHIPFCASLCRYCGCFTRVPGHDAPVINYAKTLMVEIETVAEAIGRRQVLTSLHFGGGTPNLLANDDFSDIMGLIREKFDILPDAHLAMEMDPRQLDVEKVEIYNKAGINRASLGIQDFDKVVQERIGRVQPFELVKEKIGDLRDAGIKDINFDLIYGMPGQNLETIKKGVDLTAELMPSRVALFGYAHVPWMRPHQKQLEKWHLPTKEERFEMAELARKRLEEHGYVSIGMDHFALPEDSLCEARKDGSLKRNFQGYTVDPAMHLIGVGISSISRVNDSYYQNGLGFKKYREVVEAGNVPVIKRCKLDDDDKLRGKMIERIMCDLKLDARDFGDDSERAMSIMKEARAKMGLLEEDGFVVFDGEYSFIVPVEGRPFLRVAAAAFDAYYKAEDKVERHAAAV